MAKEGDFSFVAEKRFFPLSGQSHCLCGMFVCVETVLEEGLDGTTVRFRKHKLTVETVDSASVAGSSRI